MRRLLKRGKGLTTALAGLLALALVFGNASFAAVAEAASDSRSYSAAKAVEISILPGAEGLSDLLGGVNDALGGLLGGLADGLLGTEEDEGLLGGLLGGLLNTVDGLLGGLLDPLGKSLEKTKLPLLEVLGGVLQEPIGTVNNLLHDPLGTVTAVTGSLGKTLTGLPVVGDLLAALPIDLEAILELRLGPTWVGVGITEAMFDGTSASYGSTFPLGLQLLGGDKLIPIETSATRDTAPKFEELLTVDLGALAQAGVLTGDIQVDDEKAQAIGSVAAVDVATLVTVGAVQTSAISTETYADAELTIADLSVAGLVTVEALHAKAHASLTDDPYVQIDTVDLNVLGEPMEINIGEIIDIPGILRLGLLDGYTLKEGDRVEAHGGVLEIELLGALLGGITIRIGAVDAEVEGDAGAPYNISKKALADTVEPGGIITYNIVYNMNYAANNVRIKDELPEGTTFIEATHGGQYDAATHTVTWDLGNLDEDDGDVISLKVQVNHNVNPGTVIRNVAVIEADGHEPEESNVEEVTVGSKVHEPFFIGYPDGTFKPNGPITRAEVATIIARLMGLQNLANTRVNYTDVQNHWARPYIAATTAKGIFRDNGGRFRPDDPATRAELAVALVRMHEIVPVAFAQLPGSEATFSDVKAGHWAYNEIETAVRLGFLQGNADGTFRPDATVTRAQVAAMISRALGRGPLIDGKIAVQQHFPDVTRADWFFGWVEEASMIGHKGVFTGEGEALEVYLPDVKPW